MMRATALAALLGASVALFGLYKLTDPARQNRDVAQLAPADVENWPICTSMAAGDGPAWAPLDPDFAAGKKALAAKDWDVAIAALTAAALRDTRNADIQNYLGYAYGRLRQLELAFKHYQQALALNPRHRGAHQHLGETYLVLGDLAKAAEYLAALERICLIACEEYGDLKRAIVMYTRSATR